MRKRVALVVAAALVFATQALASGSSIGNGGDPLFYFLEATRMRFVDAIGVALVDSKEKAKFCREGRLTSEQVELCRSFFFQTANQVLALNKGVKKTSFVLRKKSILVKGPDGLPMPVAARTQLGPEGVVEFHRESVKLMAPSQVLHLISHEFGHKSAFLSRYITDNERVGAFASGRELLDAVAAAVVATAKRARLIGSQYGLRDSFTCVTLVGDTPVGMRASSARYFLSDDLLSYQTSLSRYSTDPVIFVPESPQSDLVFRVVVSEPSNCAGHEHFVEERGTELAILRFTKAQGTSPSKEETLVSLKLPGYNPMCEKTPSDFGLVFGSVRFSCRYYGTEGTTASVISDSQAFQPGRSWSSF